MGRRTSHPKPGFIPALLMEIDFPHYLIIEEIEIGGMGVVFRAQDQQIDSEVAIKVLYPGTRKHLYKVAPGRSKLNHSNNPRLPRLRLDSLPAFPSRVV